MKSTSMSENKKAAPAKVAAMLFGVVGAFVLLIIVIGWIMMSR